MVVRGGEAGGSCLVSLCRKLLLEDLGKGMLHGYHGFAYSTDQQPCSERTTLGH